jgi:thiol-disulfide isomerase/thioredoxin
MSYRQLQLAAALLVVVGLGAPAARAQEVLFKKAEALTSDDPRDTKLKSAYAKSYTVKLTEGKAYRIDLTSDDFDTFLRLEDKAGKELAFNDDIAPDNLNSRLIYVAPKTAEYKLIVTTFVPNKTGDFVLEMKAATAAEAKEAIFEARVAKFGEASRAEQAKLFQEVNKSLQAKGTDLTVKDAQLALQVFLSADDSDPKFLREIGDTFVKIFEGADNKQVASVAPFLTNSLKGLDRIGTKLEIAGKKVDGKEFDLDGLKGKVVLVDFWATWCGPCIAELPNVEAAYKKYHGRGFEVIGVSLDRKGDDEKLANFIEKRKMPWGCITIEDSRKLAERYEVTSIPYPVLIGPDGRVVSLRARGPQLERLLERLLPEKK